MGFCITYAGERLMARLQAAGEPLIIDRFIFAHVPGQDHTLPVDPESGLPENIVYTAVIPDEYRAYINPNQVVYSALLDSATGPFWYNWQGLYCAEHDTLVAYATFPALEKLAYVAATNTPGNNHTRNLILSYSGVQAMTGITVEAKVWQLDFTVRLRGIDERERLSNRDIYGRAAYFDDGWKLVEEEGRYYLLPGIGYVEGIRIELKEKTEVFLPAARPLNLWLDVCMEPIGSDVVATVTPHFLTDEEAQGDYVSPAPYNIRHYRETTARITDAGITDLRPGWPGVWAWHCVGVSADCSELELHIFAGEEGPHFERYISCALLPLGATATLNDDLEILWRVPLRR